MRTSPRRRLLLGLRKRVRVQSRFTVEPLGGGRERLTCRQCGHVIEQPVGGISRATGKPAFASAPQLADRIAQYRAGVVGGICPECTRREQDRRYPLGDEA